MIRIHVYDEQEALHRAAARIVLDELAGRTDLVLGLATGSSPLGLYEQLAAAVSDRGADFSRASAFALDEYVGLAAEDPRSYRSVISEQVVGPLRMTPSSVSVPAGSHPDPHAAAAGYEAAIVAAGGVDLQILGIGRNGHIGFNEPGSPIDSVTRVVDLAHETRADNARFFGRADAVPRRAITQGIGTILRARRLLLLATGAAKAEALAASLGGPVSAEMPGSALQRHDDVVVLADRAATALLREPIRS